MGDKFNYQQWKRISLDYNKTKEYLQQMSKLFIVTNEKVKLIVRKCQTNLQYNPIKDCSTQRQFIISIVTKLQQRQQDQYLSKMDKSVVERYQKNFYSLLELLDIAQKTYESKDKINIEGLKGISQNKNTKRGEYSLRNQLQKSENRMIRTKSGHRITKNIKTSDKNKQDEEYENLMSQNNEIKLINQENHEKQFLYKKQRLQSTINKHIQKNGFSLNFQKKYDKLDDYLMERKQFADLIFSQNYYDQMIEQGKTRKNQPKVQQKRDPDLNKLFPQFNIKTKYLKKQVKQNILKVILDVKKQLLQQYHESNVTKMREANEGGMMKLNNQKKSSNKSKKRAQSQYTGSTANMQTRFRSTNKTLGQRRYSLANFNRTGFKTVQGQWKKDQYIIKQQKKAVKMFASSKMPNYQK